MKSVAAAFPYCLVHVMHSGFGVPKPVRSIVSLHDSNDGSDLDRVAEKRSANLSNSHYEASLTSKEMPLLRRMLRKERTLARA